MQAQEDLAASEAALVNSKKKVRVLKDKISLQERKAQVCDARMTVTRVAGARMIMRARRRNRTRVSPRATPSAPVGAAA